MTRLLLIAVALLALASCELLEGLNQTSPNYKGPLPGSTAWRAKRKS